MEEIFWLVESSLSYYCIYAVLNRTKIHTCIFMNHYIQSRHQQKRNIFKGNFVQSLTNHDADDTVLCS